MLGPIDERTPPMTPQLALRVAMIGGLALLLFAIIFFRLWFLQVLSGTKYVAEAQNTQVQHVSVAAPRGTIVDSTGTTLVQSVRVPSIQIAPKSLPAPVVLDGRLKLPVALPARDGALFSRLAKLIGFSTKPHRCTYTVYWTRGPVKYVTQLPTVACRVAGSVAQAPFANVTVKTNVPTYIQDYIQERITKYPGVLTQDTYVRKYKLGDAGAQTFGTLNQISPKELKVYKNVKQGDIVGQSGLEAEYNQWLQGIDGTEGVKVNAQGQFQGYAKGTPVHIGDTLKLSLNSQLEKVGQQALADSVSARGGKGGAFVAMNPESGQIYAMGSNPTYNPALTSSSMSSKSLKFFNDPANNTPLLNRAIDGQGPDGSTFKVITATAALEGGVWGLDQIYDDNGEFCFTPNAPTSDCRRNAGGSAYGAVNMVTAIQDSVDTFFYNLGDILDTKPIATYAHTNGGALQKWASAYGIGRPTGVDVPGESVGSMASPGSFQALWKREMQCEHATGPYKGRAKVPAVVKNGYVLSGGCHIADTDVWTVGDNVNAAVGQGDVQVTPMQLAVVYSAIANGGNIVTPHLAQDIQSPTGQIIHTFNGGIRRHLKIDPTYLAAIQQGLRQAVTSGTSADTLGSFPKQVYGKTGTAQYFTLQGAETDSAWYACYVPASATSKPIVVAVWVQNGGYGDVAAAPVARMILGQWFFGKPGKFQVGANTTL
ncbi:MAG TPA: penicillin-binding transpeptidase domain-containing protein [Solirubrobacteraceae bacterium]|nr:penicillin-binding transpeptidase domain-containing protein [Solirubrobacteraceae bacterium]